MAMIHIMEQKVRRNDAVIETSVIYCGDCLTKVKEIPDESVDLIYIDPPFSSNRNYVAFWQEQEKRHFEDRFENVRVESMTAIPGVYGVKLNLGETRIHNKEVQNEVYRLELPQAI